MERSGKNQGGKKRRMAEGDETGRFSLPRGGKKDTEERKTGQAGRTLGRGQDLGPHLSRDLVLVIM